MEINEISHSLASWSLTRLIQEQSYIAQNIANANVKGYQSVHADFSAALSQVQAAKDTPAELRGLLDSDTLNHKVVYSPANALNDNVQLDKELTLMFKNKSQYNGIIELLNRNMSLLKLSINSKG